MHSDQHLTLNMDNKLLCPTLSIMITKTIQALCEVNIKFDEKLEISGCLHVRADGNKVLMCLIDEESVRVAKGEQKHDPVVQMIKDHIPPPIPMLSRSPGVSQNNSLPASDVIAQNEQLQLSRNASIDDPNAHVPGDKAGRSLSASDAGLPSPSSQDQNIAEYLKSYQDPNLQSSSLPPVNSLIRNRELLLNMLEDKRKKPVSASEQGSLQDAAVAAAQQQQLAQLCSMGMVKQEPKDANGSLGLADAKLQSPGAASIPTGIPHLPGLPPFAMLANAASVNQPTAPNQPPVQSTSPQQAQHQHPSPVSTPSTTASSPPPALTYDALPAPAGGRHGKKFQCMFCGILLSTKGYLKNHINAVHTKTKVFPCDLCERIFYSSGALRIHKLRHHWVGSKKHGCPQCGDSFLLPVELRRHIEKKHQGVGLEVLNQKDSTDDSDNLRGTPHDEERLQLLPDAIEQPNIANDGNSMDATPSTGVISQDESARAVQALNQDTVAANLMENDAGVTTEQRGSRSNVTPISIEPIPEHSTAAPVDPQIPLPQSTLAET